MLPHHRATGPPTERRKVHSRSNFSPSQTAQVPPACSGRRKNVTITTIEWPAGNPRDRLVKQRRATQPAATTTATTTTGLRGQKRPSGMMPRTRTWHPTSCQELERGEGARALPQSITCVKSEQYIRGVSQAIAPTLPGTDSIAYKSSWDAELSRRLGMPARNHKCADLSRSPVRSDSHPQARKQPTAASLSPCVKHSAKLVGNETGLKVKDCSSREQAPETARPSQQQQEETIKDNPNREFRYPHPLKTPSPSLDSQTVDFHARLQRIRALQSTIQQHGPGKRKGSKKQAVPAGKPTVWDRLSSASTSDIESAKQDQSLDKGTRRLVYQGHALTEAEGLLHRLQMQPTVRSHLASDDNVQLSDQFSPRQRQGIAFPGSVSAATRQTGRRASIAGPVQQLEISRPGYYQVTADQGNDVRTAAEQGSIRRYSSLEIRSSARSTASSLTQGKRTRTPMRSELYQISPPALDQHRPIKLHQSSIYRPNHT